jgi:hypothetical protein
MRAHVSLRLAYAPSLCHPVLTSKSIATSSTAIVT